MTERDPSVDIDETFYDAATRTPGGLFSNVRFVDADVQTPDIPQRNASDNKFQIAKGVNVRISENSANSEDCWQTPSTHLIESSRMDREEFKFHLPAEEITQDAGDASEAEECASRDMWGSPLRTSIWSVGDEEDTEERKEDIEEPQPSVLQPGQHQVDPATLVVIVPGSQVGSAGASPLHAPAPQAERRRRKNKRNGEEDEEDEEDEKEEIGSEANQARSLTYRSLVWSQSRSAEVREAADELAHTLRAGVDAAFARSTATLQDLAQEVESVSVTDPAQGSELRSLLEAAILEHKEEHKRAQSETEVVLQRLMDVGIGAHHLERLCSMFLCALRSALKMHACPAALVVQSFPLITVLSQEGDLAAALVHAGILEVVSNIMITFRHKPKVQAQGCTLLEHLGCVCPPSLPSLAPGAAGTIIPELLFAMNAHPYHLPTQMAGCRALLQLTQSCSPAPLVTQDLASLPEPLPQAPSPASPTISTKRKAPPQTPRFTASISLAPPGTLASIPAVSPEQGQNPLPMPSPPTTEKKETEAGPNKSETHSGIHPALEEALEAEIEDTMSATNTLAAYSAVLAKCLTKILQDHSQFLALTEVVLECICELSHLPEPMDFNKQMEEINGWHHFKECLELHHDLRLTHYPEVLGADITHQSSVFNIFRRNSYAF
mmetsp:Transcript_31320/g.43436  ORF Transcript_31320/g.43436 Transcript_31320/m.43436 type:complete len:665 (-) Transcript_31320:225-2219(-)